MIVNKLWNLLNPKQQKTSKIYFILVFIGTLFETLGLGLVVPLVALMTTNDLKTNYPFLTPVLNALGNPSRIKLFIVTMVTLVIIYALKTIYMLALSWWRAGFILKLQASLSKQLFSIYLRQPWLQYLQRNSSQYIQNVNNEVTLMMQYGYASTFDIVNHLLLFITITTLLLIAEPIGTTIIIIIIGTLGWGFQHLSKIRISRWGKVRQHQEALRLQSLQQGINSIKDIKLRGCEDLFLDQFNYHSINLINVGRLQSVFRQLPRYLFEFLAIFGLVISIVIMMLAGKPLETIAPVVGLFAAVFIRLMPSISTILTGLHALRYIKPTVNTIANEIKHKKFSPSNLIDNNPIPSKAPILLKNINMRYSNSETFALKNINLTIPYGAFLGIVGKSGSGKSTLIDLIIGLLKPESGMITVGGINIQENLVNWQKQIGYVPQSIYLLDDTLRKNIAFGISTKQINDNTVWQVIKDAMLEELVNSLPDGIDTIIGEDGSRFSGGERQRIGIARALYTNPSILLFDEANASLDIETEKYIMQTIHQLKGKKTIIFVTHRLHSVNDCDLLIQLEDGKIIKNKYQTNEKECK